MEWFAGMKGSLRKFNDRRRAQRVGNPAILAFYCAGAEAKPHQVRDISLTGAYMCTEERWYLGTMVQITLDIDPVQPGTKGALVPVPSITLWAKVVRHDAEGVGLEFVIVQRKRLDSLRQFLAGVKARTYETKSI